MSTDQKIIKNKVGLLKLAEMELALEKPAYGQVRAANDLAKRGMLIPPA
jgi:hypothetical protein